jgi:DNA-binding response OmpR family regulator
MIEQQARDLVVMGMRWFAELGAGLGCAIRNVSAVRQIMIDSTGVELEVIKALDSGADDCTSKPVRPKELLARIIALLRRSQ